MAKAVPSLGAQPVWWFLLGLGILLAYIGPFGTFEALNLLWRIAYWLPVVVGSNLFVRAAQRIVDICLPKATPFEWQMTSICVFSLMFGPAVWAYSGLFSTEFRSLSSLLFIMSNVFGVTTAVGVLVFFMTNDPGSEGTPKRPQLYDRLPSEATTPIVRLTVDDHYVEVHLEDGSSHRLFMRLADAVREMDDTQGFFTHRSHWVALAYVVNSLREKNRDYLVLETGAKVPVSKTYRGNVEAAGFL